MPIILVAQLSTHGVLFLDFFVHHRLPILNTMFRHKGGCISTWHQDILGRNLTIDFVVMSLYLQLYVLDTQINRGVELSTNHHLVFKLDLMVGEGTDKTKS